RSFAPPPPPGPPGPRSSPASRRPIRRFPTPTTSGARSPRPPTEMAAAGSSTMAEPPSGPILFAYDGSPLAKLAIEEAARQLAAGREAVVLCVWQPAEVGFMPADEVSFDARNAHEVREAATGTAAHGASLAEQAGF